MVVLALESENGAVLTYRLSSSQITVGSSSRNDVVVRSPGVAERHLVMHRTGEVFTFVTGDRLTVVLNGERRSRGVLNPGDKIRIGGVNLVFRGGDGVEAEVAAAPRPAPATGQRQGPEKAVFLPDPAGFAAARSALVALLAAPPRDCFQRLISTLRDALPGIELAILAPGGESEPVALASVWGGNLPHVEPDVLRELAAGGRYAQVSTTGVPAVVVPVPIPGSGPVALVAARPIGSLGSEGVGLLCEAARLLGMRWRDIGRDDAAATDEKEAVRRLESLVPGSSQAIQVLRAGMLAAAIGNDPVLVCGAEGVGRTETARVLAGMGPAGSRPAVVVECRGREERELRAVLFGPTGYPSLAGSAGGALGQAAGGVLILRNADRLPEPLQAELAGLIPAQQRLPGADGSVRWFLTCGEDPLALVQQGRLGSALFLLFSRRMLRVPRLAERREDLPLLIANLLRQVAAEQGKVLRGITLECLNTLLARSFPGEMAELVGEVNRLVTATPDAEMVRCENLAAADGAVSAVGVEAAVGSGEVIAADSLKAVIPQVERLIIDRVMRRLKGNQSKAARTLEISRGALIAKLKEYGVPDYRYLRRRQPRG